MSMRIYVDVPTMQKAGFSFERERDGTSVHATLGNYRIRLIDDEPKGHYFNHGSLESDVPTELQRFTTAASLCNFFGNDLHPTRRLGMYRLGSAVAELQTFNGKPVRYEVIISAQGNDRCVRDVIELYQLIRQGQIWPTLDYEAKQVPPPFRHLKDALAEIWQLIQRDIRDRLYRIKERLAPVKNGR